MKFGEFFKIISISKTFKSDKHVLKWILENNENNQKPHTDYGITHKHRVLKSWQFKLSYMHHYVSKLGFIV